MSGTATGSWRTGAPGRACLTTSARSSEQEFDRSAADERADIEKLSVSLREELTAKGLQFNDVDREAFREALRKTTFYQDWKEKYGDEAWSYLEKFSGKLV